MAPIIDTNGSGSFVGDHSCDRETSRLPTAATVHITESESGRQWDSITFEISRGIHTET